MFLSEFTLNGCYQPYPAARDITITLICKAKNVVIDTPRTDYPLSRAGTVLHVTIVNVFLAMRINAMYNRKRYCGIFLGLLVVGELKHSETLQLS